MSDPACSRMHLLIQADLDGELDAAEAAEVAAHLAVCAACRVVQSELAAVSFDIRAQAPRHAAPASLRRSLEARLAPASPVVSLRVRRRTLGTFAAAAATAIAASVLLFNWPAQDDLAREAVASHIRALQPGHLTDVASSDQHTVKPWFDGRLDYAPPVRDFAAAGFPLVGGRLDYLGSRAVAALVYRHDKHVINLYVWPESAQAAPSATVTGYNMLGWVSGGMRFVAVSDVNAADLASLRELWRSAP